MKHSRAQQIKLCSTIHLPLDQFQSIDLSFELAIAPFVAQSVHHSFIVFAQPTGETYKLFQFALSGRAQPLIKLNG